MLAPRVRGRRLTRCDRVRGATEGEYALMLAIVIAVIVATLGSPGCTKGVWLNARPRRGVTAT